MHTLATRSHGIFCEKYLSKTTNTLLYISTRVSLIAFKFFLRVPRCLGTSTAVITRLRQNAGSGRFSQIRSHIQVQVRPQIQSRASDWGCVTFESVVEISILCLGTRGSHSILHWGSIMWTLKPIYKHSKNRKYILCGLIDGGLPYWLYEFAALLIRKIVFLDATMSTVCGILC